VTPDALGSFPYLVVLGFGMVWITFATLGVIWLATWRSTRHESAVAAAAAPSRRGLTRGRALALVGVGLLGGAILGGILSAYAAAQSGRPRGGGTAQP
jgi:hypothetical protein